MPRKQSSSGYRDGTTASVSQCAPNPFKVPNHDSPIIVLRQTLIIIAHFITKCGILCDGLGQHMIASWHTAFATTRLTTPIGCASPCPLDAAPGDRGDLEGDLGGVFALMAAMKKQTNTQVVIQAIFVPVSSCACTLHRV